MEKGFCLMKSLSFENTVFLFFFFPFFLSFSVTMNFGEYVNSFLATLRVWLVLTHTPQARAMPAAVQALSPVLLEDDVLIYVRMQSTCQSWPSFSPCSLGMHRVCHYCIPVFEKSGSCIKQFVRLVCWRKTRTSEIICLGGIFWHGFSEVG